MARPRNDTYTVERNAVILIHEFGDGDVFVGDDALDGGDDEFVFERYPERLQRSLDIGRRDGQHNKVGLLEHLVHVARDVEAVGVEVYVLQVEGVGTVRSDAFAYLRFTDIPRYSFFVFEKYFDDGGRPASGAYHRAAGIRVNRVFHV